MTSLELELAHLIRLATRQSWQTDHAHAEFKKLAWAKALRLQSDPDFPQLPELLTQAMQSKQTSESSNP
jgi:hypothetical protein